MLSLSSLCCRIVRRSSSYISFSCISLCLAVSYTVQLLNSQEVILRKNKKYFSSGEFAKLTGVNKRTLHYYNDIGLFRPEIIGENGYHYYSAAQFAQLELILILRRVGSSIEEIRDYLTGPSETSFSQMMEKKKKLIDDSIDQLLSIQAFLDQKADRKSVV